MDEFLQASDLTKTAPVIVTATNLLLVMGMLLEDPQNQELYDYAVREYENSGLMQVVKETMASKEYSVETGGISRLRQFSEEVEIKNSHPNDIRVSTYLYKVKD